MMPVRPTLALCLLLVAYTLSFVDRTILGIVQQPMKVELGLTDAQLGLLGGTAFALFYGILGIPIARLAERGRRPAIVAGAIFIWSLATMACGGAAGFAQLLAARMLVGVGEAGCTPPAHAILSNLYTPERPTGAISIYALGVPLGVLVGAVAGGIVAEAIGWRLTFVVAGLPGLLLAPAILLIREPSPVQPMATTPTLRAVVRRFTTTRALLRATAGIVIASLAGYALLAFLPSLLQRRFDFSLAQAGLATGLVTGIGAGIGTLAGGQLVDRLARRAPKLALLIPAVGFGIAIPLLVSGFLTGDWRLALILLFLGTIAQFAYLGPTYATAQSLVPCDMRATTSALILLAVNLIGLGLGPPLLGWASDRLTLGGRSPGDALCSAMALTTLLFAWAAWHYARGARTLAVELTPVTDAAGLLARLPDIAGARPVALDPIGAGRSNPTYRLTTSSGGQFVLRTRPADVSEPTAHRVDREVAVLRALRPTVVPVPLVVVWETAPETGQPYYIMPFVAGEVFEDPALPMLDPDARTTAYEAAIDALAALHALDPDAIGLGAFGAPGDHGQRQIARWFKQIAQGAAPDALLALGRSLTATPPRQTRRALVHGDYRFGNLIVDPATGALGAIVDWELATIGDPLSDLAYLALGHLLPRDGAVLPGLSDDLPAGVLTIDALLQRYLMVSGTALPDDWDRHQALALFRCAGISLGVIRRRAGGCTPSPADLAEIARLADLGLSILSHPSTRRRPA